MFCEIAREKGSKGIEQAGGNGKRESSARDAKLRPSAATHSSGGPTPIGFIHVHPQGTRAPQTCVYRWSLATVESC